MSVETEPQVARVHAAHVALTEARERVAAAEDELTQAVRVALLVGASAVDLAEVLGVTRSRVYQIRDGRR